MTCCLFGVKPLPEQIVAYYQLKPEEQTSVNRNWNFNIFIRKNALENIVRKVAAILIRAHSIKSCPCGPEAKNMPWGWDLGQEKPSNWVTLVGHSWGEVLVGIAQVIWDL